MYFTTYRSTLLIVIDNTIVITWCILENVYVGSELLNAINIKNKESRTRNKKLTRIFHFLFTAHFVFVVFKNVSALLK